MKPRTNETRTATSAASSRSSASISMTCVAESYADRADFCQRFSTSVNAACISFSSASLDSQELDLSLASVRFHIVYDHICSTVLHVWNGSCIRYAAGTLHDFNIIRVCVFLSPSLYIYAYMHSSVGGCACRHRHLYIYIYIYAQGVREEN
jgi:hypothetical protein